MQGAPRAAQRVLVEDQQCVLAPGPQFHRDPRGPQRPAVRLQFEDGGRLAAAHDGPVVQGQQPDLDLVAEGCPQLGPPSFVLLDP